MVDTGVRVKHQMAPGPDMRTEAVLESELCHCLHTTPTSAVVICIHIMYIQIK